jgi:hypothetical protein
MRFLAIGEIAVRLPSREPECTANQDRDSFCPAVRRNKRRVSCRYGGSHRLHHCQEGKYAARCYDQSTCDSCDPSAPSILSNFIQACFDRLVLSSIVRWLFLSLAGASEAKTRTSILPADRRTGKNARALSLESLAAYSLLVQWCLR